jgi:TrmH family RNA methyltransferase
VPVAHVDDLAVLLDWAREGRLQTVASSARAGMSFWDAPYRRPALLLLGSEGQGLSPEVIAAADLSVRIPMHGSATSLNLAVAAGLLLFEMDRRRDR